MKQLAVFFGLAMVISWLTWLPLYAPVLGIPYWPALPYNHALGALGPLIAAIITTSIFRGTAGLKELVKKTVQSGRTGYLLIAFFSPFILLLIAILADCAMNGSRVDLNTLLQVKEFPHFNIAIFFLYNLFFFGFGEEVGWRGFALPLLQNRMNALSAAVLLTVFWALWHLPLFLYRPGYTGMDAAGIAGWFFSLLTGSVLLTWLYNSTAGSILVCAVFHSTIDVAFTANFSGSAIVGYLGMLVTLWGIAVIVICKPARLSRYPKFTGQTQ